MCECVGNVVSRAAGPIVAKLAHTCVQHIIMFTEFRLVCRFPIKFNDEEEGEAVENLVRTSHPDPWHIGLLGMATTMYVRGARK